MRRGFSFGEQLLNLYIVKSWRVEITFLVILLFVVVASVTIARAEIQNTAELQEALAQYSAEQQNTAINRELFDAKQGIGAQYHYIFITPAASASSGWLSSGNTKVAAYNSQGVNVGSIDLSNIIQDGKIDLLNYTGLSGKLRSSGEFAVTYGNNFELTYFNLSGNATAYNQILTHPYNGTINSYIASTLNNDLNVDVFSVQKGWKIGSVDPIEFEILVGAKAIMARYNFALQAAVPSDIMRQNYSGTISNSLPLPVPYAGVGYRVNLGDFYVSNTFAGLPGLPGFLSNMVKGVNTSFFQMNLDCNYRATEYATIQAGYRVMNITATIPASLVSNYLGDSFVLPAEFGNTDIVTSFNGPYLGVNIHF